MCVSYIPSLETNGCRPLLSLRYQIAWVSLIPLSFSTNHFDINVRPQYPPSKLGYAQTISDSKLLGNSLKPNTTITGVLYFPSGGNCSDPSLTDNGVPENGVSIGQLPLDTPLLALIPLSECTSQYLSQANTDHAAAAVLYSSSPSAEFPSGFSFNQPVYGILANEANALLQGIMDYSGNITAVPNGEALSAQYGAGHLVRLYMTITPSPPSVNWVLYLGLTGGGAFVLVLMALWLGSYCGRKAPVSNYTTYNQYNQKNG